MSRYCYRFGLVDIPNDRSSHELPTPRGGGVGIFVAFIVSSLFLKLPLLLWVPAAFLSLASFIDDKLELSPRTRLILQFASAFAVLLPFISSFSPHWGGVTPYLLILPLCIFIVGTANFYNFMDGINGIAGISGAVGFALISLFVHIRGLDPALAIFAASIAAACLGFLPLNIPQARIFMGDIGSILLGFSFAALCVLLSRTMLDFIVLCGFLSTFYADALTTLYIRKRNGERLQQAHRSHIYQLLANQLRIPHWKVSLVYGLIQGAVGLILLALQPSGTFAVVAAIFSIMCMWCWVSSNVRRKVNGPR